MVDDVPSADLTQEQRVLRRAREIWSPEAADIWMTSQNAHLGGARPADVLAVRGPDEVLAALEAEAEGAFA